MSVDIFSIDNVSHGITGGKLLIDNVSFSVKHKDCILLSGVSGGGKSTFLRLLVKLEFLQSGKILFCGEDISRISPEKLRSKAALLHQTPLITHGSIRDNLLLPFSMKVNKDLRLPADNELSAYLERVHLSDLNLDTPASSLSGGQMQRLCIIRTLLLKPQIVLLDEPFSALDKESANAVSSLLEKENSNGLTIMMVSHVTPDIDPKTLTHLELRDSKLKIVSQGDKTQGDKDE